MSSTSSWHLIIGILSGFGGTGVLVKSQALSVVNKPYIEAARIAGGSPFHIILVHVVPNLLPLSFLYMMFTVTSAIFSEAVLSFLGLLDVRMSWGLMIHTTESAGYLLQVGEYWWLIFPASLSITLLCSSFYLVGRALDEVVNPKAQAQVTRVSTHCRQPHHALHDPGRPGSCRGRRVVHSGARGSRWGWSVSRAAVSPQSRPRC